MPMSHLVVPIRDPQDRDVRSARRDRRSRSCRCRISSAESEITIVPIRDLDLPIADRLKPIRAVVVPGGAFGKPMPDRVEPVANRLRVYFFPLPGILSFGGSLFAWNRGRHPSPSWSGSNGSSSVPNALCSEIRKSETAFAAAR
jgi:hypothetical protein